MTSSVKPAPSSPLLEAQGVTLEREGRRLLDGVSVTLGGGELLAVLGPNGAGKSTLLRVLAGVVPAERGEVKLGGLALASLTRRQIAQQLAVVPQRVEVPAGVTVEEVVLSGRAPHQDAFLRVRDEDRRAVEDALARCELEGLRDRAAETLSGGEFHRVIVARALAQQAPVLLLDEPTAHLDLRHASRLMALLRREVDERGLAVLAVLHDLTTAALFADRALLLAQGRVVAAGDRHEVMRREALEGVFGVALAPVQLDGVTTFLPRKPNSSHAS